jgi:hypothetical protein|tara:strand:- start:1571 stop:2197 length:627 start_codon:yes stop_codon:yes gene_type:complete
MSFNKLNYDTCSYKQALSESVGPCEYQLGMPFISCEDCFSKDPQLILQRMGASVAKNVPMVDVDSELLNINRKLSNCSSNEFIPKFDKNGEIDNTIESVHFKDCNIPTRENTRLSNPPATLRGTGWNRWEWLCENPQTRSLIPFDYNINNRLVTKDNHRPLVPRPIDQSVFLPPQNNNPIRVEISQAPAVPLGPVDVNFSGSSNIREF